MKNYPKVVDLLTKRDVAKLRRASPNTIVLAYKISRYNGTSPQHPNCKPSLRCRKGAVLRVSKPDRDERRNCGAGVNVGTWNWCQDHAYWGYADDKHGVSQKGVLWQVAFRRSDIACIPKGHDGKIRLYRCRVVGQVMRRDLSGQFEW